MKLIAERLGKLILLFGVLGLVAGCASDNSKIGTSAVLRGMVYNTNRMPMLDVKVSEVKDGKEADSALSDIHGRYFIPAVPYGPVTLRFTKSGYEPLDWSFAFGGPTQIVYVQIISLNDLLDRAADSVKKRDWEAASAYLARVRKMEPDNVVASYLEGEMLSAQGSAEQAAELLEKLSTDKATYFAVELALADLYQNKLALPDKALIHLKKAALIRDDIDIENRITALEKR